MIIPVKVAKVKANGKRFLVVKEERGKVYCKGEVQRVGGFSAVHGPGKVFLADRVEVTELDYTMELLHELHRESTMVLEKPLPPPPPPRQDAPRRERKPKEKEDRSKRRWVKIEGIGGRRFYQFTSHGRDQLWKMGYGMAEDGLGNYIDEHQMGDAAMDVAAYIPEMTRDGVPEGYSTAREMAADYIHDGMQAALKKAKAEGRKTTLERA